MLQYLPDVCGGGGGGRGSVQLQLEMREETQPAGEGLAQRRPGVSVMLLLPFGWPLSLPSLNTLSLAQGPLL